MRFGNPIAGVVSLVAFAVVLALWIAARKRRRRDAVKFSDPELLAALVPKTSGFRRNVGIASILIALLLCAIAAGDPQRETLSKERSSRIILAIDVSGSMGADDIAPSRIEAAKEAARRFVAAAPNGVEVGVVTFSDGAQPVSPPTLARRQLREAIDRMEPETATAIGEGLYSAMGLLETDGWVEKADGSPAIQRRIGQVVLLTDGENTAGRDPIAAAEVAKQARVRIQTIGFGTGSGSVNGQAVGFDTEALQKIASISGGKYTTANSAQSLTEVFTRIAKATRPSYTYQSFGSWFVLAAALVLAVGTGIALRRSPRVP